MTIPAFQTFRWRDRRLFAAATTRSDGARLAADHLRPFSWRRAALYRAARSGLPAAGFRRYEDPDPLGLGFVTVGALIERWEGMLGHEAEAVIIEWPRDPERGRVYLRLFGAGEQPLAFVKLATSAAGADGLRTERARLGAYEQDPPRLFRTPKVLFDDRSDPLTALALAPIPVEARRVRWRDRVQVLGAIDELSPPGRASWRDGPPPWLDQFVRRADDAGLGRDRKALLADGVEAGYTAAEAHGDLTPANALIEAGRPPWVFDWEHASSEVPASGDRVAFLAHTHRMHNVWPITARRGIHYDYAARRLGVAQGRLEACIAYRISVGDSLAVDWAKARLRSST